MLHLHLDTPKGWAERVLGSMPEILLDHAHCEKKAASTALSLIFRYPQHRSLVTALSQLAREELAHFEQVLGHLERRGICFGRQKPSPYAGKLMSIVRVQEPDRLLDTLLCCAFIEARSSERMKLLSEALEDDELRALYKGLLAAEARHHALFVHLAVEIFPKDVVEDRMKEIGAHEAQVIADAPMIPRLHN